MNNIGNPFVECTSRDMSFEEVTKYWCEPFSCYSIDYSTLRNSATPIIIEGPRGSGKTMILKYISYFCQKERFFLDKKSATGASFLMRLQSDGSLGIYFRYKDDFGSLFKFLNCSSQSKEELFLYYYEMYILDELFKVIQDMYLMDTDKTQNWNELISELNSFFGAKVTTIKDFSALVENKIQTVDQWVRNSRYIERADEKLHTLIDGKGYVSSVCNILRKNIAILSQMRFLIIIDEYENASDYQQILNTLLKQVDHTSNITYRIGSRPKGIKTLQTNVGAEFLQLDRDFLLVVLQSQEMSKYKKFVREVANRRLKSIDFFVEHGLTDICLLLGSRENFENEAREVVKGRNKHFEVLKNGDALNYNNIDAIKYPDSPIMEMLNILWVLRGKSAGETRFAMESYLAGAHKGKLDTEAAVAAHKYKLDYSDKYHSQLLFVLLGIYGQNKKYYSFNTFAYLSSGAVNDFISLCRNVFYQLDESYYETVSIMPQIPIAIQAIGAEKTAIEQMDKVQMCNENGMAMYCFAMNIGGLFRYFHRDIYARYPETNQIAFENEVEIENRPLLSDVYNSLIKWGVIIKKPRIQSISIGRRKGALYYLNRIYAPIFGISYRTRGGYNFIVSTDLFEELLNAILEPNKIESWKTTAPKRQLNVSAKKQNDADSDPAQITLFEVLDNGE